MDYKKKKPGTKGGQENGEDEEVIAIGFKPGQIVHNISSLFYFVFAPFDKLRANG
jgi:hypothetical protein